MSKRRICILGGCGGIGRSLVAACVENGADVAVMDLKSALERHPPPPSVMSIEIDGTDEASVTTAFGRLEASWGALDGFVNSAGFLIEKRKLADTPASEFDITMAGNLRMTFLVSKAAMKLLEKGDAPSLVNISSGLAALVRPDYGPYGATKAAMIALTKTLALEHAPRVRCNAIGPGLVDTAFLRGGTGRSDENKTINVDVSLYNATIPMRRIAVPDDLVEPVMFLLGPQSAYMTGQTLWVNGGAYMP
ncbi:MAG: SDR family oxidoreductase [Pseudolabrys sp.]|nr:SDR family oxidoreductase [Pseudolabrys sp.]